MSLPFFNTRTPPVAASRPESPQQEPLDLSLPRRRDALVTPVPDQPGSVLAAVDALRAASTAGAFAPPARYTAGPGPVSATARAVAKPSKARQRLDPDVKAARAAERARQRAIARAQAPAQPAKQRPSQVTGERRLARAAAQATFAEARKAARADHPTNRQLRQIASGMSPAAFGRHIRSVTALNKVDEQGRQLYRKPDGSADLLAHDRDERAARQQKRIQEAYDIAARQPRCRR